MTEMEFNAAHDELNKAYLGEVVWDAINKEVHDFLTKGTQERKRRCRSINQPGICIRGLPTRGTR